jgi:hypothetical protein
MRLPACLKRFAHMIDEISDERGGGDGYWVYLKAGWIDADGETHCVHEDTPKECALAMGGVVKCEGACCVS